jgi:hypothetical protein
LEFPDAPYNNIENGSQKVVSPFSNIAANIDTVDGDLGQEGKPVLTMGSGGSKDKVTTPSPRQMELIQVPSVAPKVNRLKRRVMIHVLQDMIHYSKVYQKPTVIMVIDPKLDIIDESAGTLIINTFASVLTGSTTTICLATRNHQVDFKRVYRIIPDYVHIYLISDISQKGCTDFVQNLNADIALFAISNQQARIENTSKILYGNLVDLKIEATCPSTCPFPSKVITVVTQVDDGTEVPYTKELDTNGTHCSLRVIASRVDRVYPSNKIGESTNRVLS